MRNGGLWLNWNIRVCMEIRSLTFIWLTSFKVCVISRLKTLEHSMVSFFLILASFHAIFKFAQIHTHIRLFQVPKGLFSEMTKWPQIALKLSRMTKIDTIECSRVFNREITQTLNEYNQINVKLLISRQTLIFQFSHSPPLRTLRLGDLCYHETKSQIRIRLYR